jgi:hypothetical protein
VQNSEVFTPLRLLKLLPPLFPRYHFKATCEICDTWAELFTEGVANFIRTSTINKRQSIWRPLKCRLAVGRDMWLLWLVNKQNSFDVLRKLSAHFGEINKTHSMFCESYPRISEMIWWCVICHDVCRFCTIHVEKHVKIWHRILCYRFVELNRKQWKAGAICDAIPGKSNAVCDRCCSFRGAIILFIRNLGV